MAKDIFNNSSSVTVGEWFVIYLLMLIPILNIILLIKWAFSTTEKESKSNWAKFVLIISVVVFLISGMTYFFTMIGTLLQ